MRVLIKLKTEQVTPQPLSHHSIQGFVYSVIKDIDNSLHDKENNRYKFFCFSNLFPYTKNKSFAEGEIIDFIFSSSNRELVEGFIESLENRRKLRIDSNHFTYLGAHFLNNIINNGIYSTTPVIISLHERLFSKYHLESDREYLYWTPKMPFNAFVQGISINLVRKFNSFFNEDVNENY